MYSQQLQTISQKMHTFESKELVSGNIFQGDTHQIIPFIRMQYTFIIPWKFSKLQEFDWRFKLTRRQERVNRYEVRSSEGE